MRYLLLLLLLFFISCVLVEPDDFWHNPNSNDFSSYTVDQLVSYCYLNVDYKRTCNTYSTPAKIEYDGKGNCRARAIWVLSILWRDQRIKGNYVDVDTKGDGDANHCMIRVNGKLYMSEKNYAVKSEIDFDDIPFRWANKL